MARLVLLLACAREAAAFEPSLPRSAGARGRALASALASAPSRTTGMDYLSPEARERAMNPKANPIEKMKIVKDGTSAFTDVYEYAAAIRAGTLTWEDVEKQDFDNRLKWVGLLHRSKRTPGKFMMRLRTPNGVVTSSQLRFYAESVEPYGPELGVVDITTRQSIQLRGVELQDADKIIDGLAARNQTSFQSALDNIRNLVGSPLAGIDALELVDTRPFCENLNDMASLNRETGQRGNPQWGNLPRKFNIAVSGGRDDYAHTHINDIGLQPVKHAKTGVVGFNVVLGGYFSIKRSVDAVHMDLWMPADVGAVDRFCEAILEIFRDEGARGNRQEARLRCLVDKLGVDVFRAKVVAKLPAGEQAQIDVEQAQDAAPWARRELLGVHAQVQPGLSRVGVHVPSGRLSVQQCRDLADLADKYSGGECRVTVDQNAIFANVKDADVAALLAEKALNQGYLAVNPGNIVGHSVTCTGAQFCGLGLIETKGHADVMTRALQAKFDVPTPLRIHWTGCPNSCAQVQVADIGIMGAPARKVDAEGKAKAVPGCNIFVGGTIGEDSQLSLEPWRSGVPLEDLQPIMEELIVEKFGATPKK
ncbi:nitrite reductase-ferredoxin dependent [Pelagophyceae sp. CCMP2097]|nr:nitrite reductase-ferredoxin dependent [Pelagophyceae sp. CCMP2097]